MTSDLDRKTGDASHDWFFPRRIGYECCRNCGIVRRDDRKNATCRGLAIFGGDPVEPREDAAWWEKVG